MYSVLSFIDHQFHSFRVTDQLSAGVNCNYMFLKPIDATITRALHYPAAGTHTDPCMCAEHYTRTSINCESNVSCRFAWSWCCRFCAYKANVDHLALACIYSSQLLSHSLESLSLMFPNPNLIVVVYKLHYASVFCALPDVLAPIIYGRTALHVEDIYGG
jgi:hypothetical protein